MTYALDLPYMLFVELVNKAFEERHEVRLFQRWIPYQAEMPFTEFKEKLTEIRKTNDDHRTAKDILVEVDLQLARMRN